MEPNFAIPAPVVETGAAAAPAQSRAPAAPVAFGDCRGYLHRSWGNVGVVFCGAWGYQELCTRAAWRMLAEELAAAGFPCLRFDYPGAGNSLGDLDDRRLTDWTASAQAAALELRRRAGVERIVVAGIGHGAIVAVEACRAGLDAAGLVLLAPVASGRRFAREMATWTAFATAPDQSDSGDDPDATVVAGFRMPGAMARAVNAFAIDELEAPPAPFALIALREGRNDSGVARALLGLGCKVETVAFDGYPDMMVSPTESKPPVRMIAGVTDALSRRFAPVQASLTERSDPRARVDLRGPDFVEDALRFGDGDRLFGVLCSPAQSVGRTPVVLMLNAGRNPHTGWRRMNVEMARDLARVGVASLRFDLSGIGESLPAQDQPAQLLYSDWCIGDVSRAIDVVAARRLGPVVLFGVCSGAFLALRAARDDTRVAGLVCANVYRLVWDPAESVEEALRFGNRPVGGAIARLSGARIRAILTGRADIGPKLQLAIRRAVRRLGVLTMEFAGRLSPRHALYAEFRALFDRLHMRDVGVVLAYGPDDEGLNDFRDFFGRSEAGLRRYANIRRTTLPDRDHNLTAPEASRDLVGQIARLSRELLRSDAPAALRAGAEGVERERRTIARR